MKLLCLIVPSLFALKTLNMFKDSIDVFINLFLLEQVSINLLIRTSLSAFSPLVTLEMSMVSFFFIIINHFLSFFRMSPLFPSLVLHKQPSSLSLSSGSPLNSPLSLFLNAVTLSRTIPPSFSLNLSKPSLLSPFFSLTTTFSPSSSPSPSPSLGYQYYQSQSYCFSYFEQAHKDCLFFLSLRDSGSYNPASLFLSFLPFFFFFFFSFLSFLSFINPSLYSPLYRSL